MNEHAEVEVALTGLGRPCRQGRSESTFGLAEAAFDLPPLAVLVFRKVGGHFAPVFRLRRFLGGSAAAGGDDAASPESLSHEGVVTFGVVARIGDQTIERQALVRGERRLGELAVVRLRADVRNCRDEEVASGIGDDAQLGEVTLLAAGALPVIRAGVAALVAGGVYRRQIGAFGDEAALARCRDRAVQELCEAPFFRSRSCA